MKRSWITWPIVGGVILLLTIFLALQYNWLVEGSEAEREKMQKRVEADTRQFADDFNREIQAAYFNFQIDADSWNRKDWTEFNERFDYWRSKTEFPGLVRDLVFLKAGSEETLRYDAEKRVFEQAALSNETRELKTLVEDPKTFKPIYADKFVLAMPVHDRQNKFERILKINPTVAEDKPVIEMPERAGHLLIFLNRDMVTNEILPALAKKHFSDGMFDVAVTEKDKPVFRSAGEVSTADATADLLTLSPDNLIFFSNKDILPRQQHGEKQQGVVINQHVESRTFSRTDADSNTNEGRSKTFTIELKADQGRKERSTIFTSIAGVSDGWKLNVQHAAGSVDAFVSGERNKRLLIGLGIYFLVIGAIVSIAYSAMRSQRFAQRQIDFVSSVSHEFRTPIAVIYSAGENLADGITKDEGQIKRYGELIKGEGKKLSSKVEQILEFAGARSGKRKYTFAEANIDGIVAASLAEAEPLLDEKQFAVETDLGLGSEKLKVDSEALESAVHNLIQNAVKYSNGNRWLRVSTSKKGNHIDITVEDRGIGIASSELSKVFEPFYRSREVVDSQIHGNGLGLSLVKEIAEAHGGKVSAASEPGLGSKFTSELPQL